MSLFEPYEMLMHIDGKLASIKTIAQRIIPSLTLSEYRCDWRISRVPSLPQLRMSQRKTRSNSFSQPQAMCRFDGYLAFLLHNWRIKNKE